MVLVRAAQARYTRTAPSAESGQVIVVLAGQVQEPQAPLPSPLLGENSYARCLYAVWLHQRMPNLPILLSGGPVGPGSKTIDAGVMRDFAIRSGVPDSLIWLEDRSTSTYENALYSATILRPKAIREVILVTDAIHMFRAQRVFEKVGFKVIPAPCRFRPVYEWDFYDWLPSLRAIAWNEEVFHEAAGLFWYRIQGRA
jgi:uncharacterized SAM-binding protein YcdF (DUF218 family)